MKSAPMPRRTFFIPAFLVFIYLFALGTRGLNEPDEGRYTNIAVEMLEPGQDKWDPVFSDVGHYDKPPLIYWVTSLTLALGGRNEWAARAPSLLGAALTLIGLFWATLRLYNRKTAWLAIWIAGTCLHLWACGRLITPDMFLTGWTTLAIAAWTETRHRSGSRGFYLLQILFWTLAWWTKATPALVPFAGLTLYTWLSQDRRDRQALRPLLSFLLILLFGSPWYLYILWKHPELTGFFFKRELVGRVTGHVDGRRGVPGYHFMIALLVWLPWWPYVLYHRIRERGKPALRKLFKLSFLKMEGVVVCLGLIIFSLISSKLPTYILTLSPWAALLMARGLATKQKFPWGPGLTAGLLFSVLAILAPRFEASMDKNSSMRPLCKKLNEKHARYLLTNRHFSGLEFYWPEEQVFYLNVAPIEISSSEHPEKEHFILNSNRYAALPPDTWLVVLARDHIQDPELKARLLTDQQIKVGDFLLIPLSNPAESP